jgi:hypothetical protein
MMGEKKPKSNQIWKLFRGLGDGVVIAEPATDIFFL